jgi:hypothetical protein
MQPQRPSDAPDEVDRLFGRLRSVAPPPDLTARILRALPTEPPAVATPRAVTISSPTMRHRWGWVTAVAGVVLLVMSLRLGTLLDDSGALGVLGQIFSDFGSFMSAPGDYLAPLASELPWLDLLVALGALVVFFVGSSASVDGQSNAHRNGAR